MYLLRVLWLCLISGIYFLLAIPVVVLYGLYIGIVGKTVANWLDLLNACRQDLVLWKLYPKKSYKDYISTLNILKNRKNSSPWMIGENFRDLEEKHPNEPLTNLWLRWILNTAIFSVIQPFRWGAGLIEGPEYAFRFFMDFWRENILHRPAVNRYVEQVRELREEIARKRKEQNT